jgi:hypothetical protein
MPHSIPNRMCRHKPLPGEAQQGFARNAQKVSGSLAVYKLFMRKAHWKLHTKDPRYEVESKWVLQGASHLLSVRYAMYISILSHK